MATKEERALAKLRKWRDRRFKLSEIHAVTGLSVPYLSQLLAKVPTRTMSEEVAINILAAEMPK